MRDKTFDERASTGMDSPPSVERRVLGHPLAYLVTAALLLALFGWTFVDDPDRVAPTRDPAYYTWRTEALISEDPQTLLEIKGSFDMFAGGYRVAAPVLGGLLRRVADVSSLRMTVLLMVLVPVLTALLLGGFAYSRRRDPLLFHSVALLSASLFLTPPFIGYLDNVLCLLFLAAALFFIEPARTSWPARFGFGVLLVSAGLTHPTTLAIFGLALGAMAAVRLLFRRFDLRSVLRDDGPMLATAFGSALIVLAIWSVGVWGESASLTEAALPPPYGSDFFIDRMNLWIEAMQPALNLPLFALGVVGLLVAGRRWAEDELGRISLVWLAPLVGLFGFVAGLTYPYYRFFNTTLSWVLLVGVGAFFAARVFIWVAERGGAARLALLGVVALAAVVGANFSKGFEVSHWNDPDKGWLSDEERTELDSLRAMLASEDRDRPVVFVVDDEPPRPFQIWAFTKQSGNTSRYALPSGQIDRGYLYLGSLENLVAGEPTLRGEETYDKLSPALLEESQQGIAASGQEPVIVVADVLNPAGANAEIAAAGQEASPELPNPGEGTLWTVDDNQVIDWSVEARGAPVVTLTNEDPGAAHLIRVVIGLIALL
ncbi:MAG: hypothetical protein ACRDJJ_02140, partial [Actinomycetota bacterium]